MSVKAVFERLRAGSAAFARTNPAERVAKLRGLQQAVMDHLDEIDAAGEAEINMSGLGQLLPLKEEIGWACAHLETWMQHEEAEPAAGLAGRRGYFRLRQGLRAARALAGGGIG